MFSKPTILAGAQPTSDPMVLEAGLLCQNQ
jgi:hypothetical protein